MCILGSAPELSGRDGLHSIAPEHRVPGDERELLEVGLSDQEPVRAKSRLRPIGQLDPRFGGFLNNNIGDYQVAVNGDIRASRSICETAPDPQRRIHNALPLARRSRVRHRFPHIFRGES
jgi:hypothetical protein